MRSLNTGRCEAVGSVLRGLAPNVYALIAFWVLQGVGAAMTMALGMAIVTESFPPAERLEQGRHYGGCALFLSG